MFTGKIFKNRLLHFHCDKYSVLKQVHNVAKTYIEVLVVKKQ